MTIHRLPAPDCAPSTCPLCREPLCDDGDCPQHGNIAQAAQERRADVQADKDQERETL